VNARRAAEEAATGLALTIACVLAGRAVLFSGPSRALPVYQAPDFPAPALHADEVASYAMSASLAPERHSLHGKATVTWRNASRAAVRELFVHLYLNAFRSSESVWMQERRPGSGRGVGALTTFGSIDVQRFSVREHGGQNLWGQASNANAEHPHDQTDVRVPLPIEVAPGATIHIDVEWDSGLPNIVERTGFSGSFHMVGQWFPKIARLQDDGSFAHFPFHHLSEFYADFGKYTVDIDVPEAFRIAAVGARVSEKLEGGRRIERYEQADIHDFSFAAWDRFQVREADADGVKLRAWYPSGFEARADEQLQAAAFAIRHMGQRYGAYPYRQLTIVSPPPEAMEAGGMEYPTLITTGTQWYWPSWIAMNRGVTVHEFGHNHFYGLVATDEHRWPFLDEGITQYAELEALDSGWGAGALIDVAGLQIGSAAVARSHALPGRNAQTIAQPAEAFATAQAYESLVYGRTALILLTMERVYPGATTRALGAYARKQRFRHPTPEELYQAFEDAAGKQAREQLELALGQRGWIDYALRSLSCEAKSAPFGLLEPSAPAVAQASAGIEGQVCEVVVARHGTMSLPVAIELISEDGERTVQHWDGAGETLTVRRVGARPIAYAVIDPEHRVLLDEDLSNNALRREGPARAGNVLWGGTFATMVAIAGVAP
jgi:hypothetical protein